jgi:hypothetical protein
MRSIIDIKATRFRSIYSSHALRPIYTICSLHSCLSIADTICLISLFRRYVISRLS